MRKILFLISFVLVVLITNLKAQDLTNYNLYVQNSFLYNPAAVVSNNFMSAYLNTHLQWIGFDGAPKTNTLGISTPIAKNMGLGLSIYQHKRGIISNFSSRLAYAYKAEFSENQYLNMGISLGFMNDKLSSSDVEFADATDEVFTDEAFNSTTISASAGSLYRLSNLEAQVIFPQFYDKGKANLYTIGTLSYNFELNQAIALKPTFMVRGVKTSPSQFEGNLNVMLQNKIWCQAGYRSDESLIFGVGFNLKGVNLAYAYQMDNSEISTVSTGTHEIQLIYNFKEMNRVKSISVNGNVKDATNSNPINAEVKVTDAEGVEIKNQTTDATSGNYNFSLKQGQTYTFNLSATDYYPHTEMVTITEEDIEKIINVTLISKFATVKGTVLRIDNNKPIATDVDIFENDAKISTVKTDATTGAFEVKLQSEKTYVFKIAAKNYMPSSQNLTIAALENKKAVSLSLTPFVSLTEKVTNKADNTSLNSVVNLYKNGTLLETQTVTGTYNFSVEKGAKYELEFKATDFLVKKTQHDYTSVSKYEFTNDVQLEKMSKESFSLGAINFKTGTAELTDDSYETLDKLVAIMKDDNTLKVEISGHTDSDGADDKNQEISDLRAKACADYVISKGIGATRVTPKGYGETKPIAKNDTPENKAKNRRVEFKFID